MGTQPAALKIKRLSPDALLPRRATPAATGLGVHACLVDRGTLSVGLDVVLVPTGIACEAPVGFDFQIRPRSGLARQGVHVILGALDSDYRVELFVSMHTFGTRQSYTVDHGDRIAQLVISKVEALEVLEVAELDETDRGSGGHGSTGR